METRRPGIDPREKYVALTTYRSDGSMVTTPVWFVDGPHDLRVITDADAGKAKRIQADETVLVAACDMRGRVTGPQLEGTATVDDDASVVAALRGDIDEKYGLAAAGIHRIQAALDREPDHVELRIRVGPGPQ